MESSGPMMSSHLHSLTQSRMAVTHLIVVLLFYGVERLHGERRMGVTTVIRQEKVINGQASSKVSEITGKNTPHVRIRGKLFISRRMPDATKRPRRSFG